MLTPPDGLREVARARELSNGPLNLNFFCHVPPVPDAVVETRWRARLAPFRAELGVTVEAGGIHGATFSSAGVTNPRTIRARPVRFSDNTGLRLCGIAEEPFCPLVKRSSASRTSVLCK